MIFLLTESEIEKRNEINRVLKAFKLNPYEILSLKTSCTMEDVKTNFRNISLLIHPDKVKPEMREKAEKAFHKIGEAKAEMEDVAKKENLDKLTSEAFQRVVRFKEQEWKQKTKEEKLKQKQLHPQIVTAISIDPSDPPPELLGDKSATAELAVMPDVTKDHDFDTLMYKEIKEMLIAREWRKRQLLKEAARQEGQVATNIETRKRDREKKDDHEKDWNDGRESRIGSWRDFMGIGRGKKAATKLMKMPRIKQEDEQRSFVRRPVKRG